MLTRSSATSRWGTVWSRSFRSEFERMRAARAQLARTPRPAWHASARCASCRATLSHLGLDWSQRQTATAVCRCVKWYGAGLMLGACPLKPVKDGKGPGELCRGRLAWISCLHSVCVDARSCASHALQAMLCAGDCRSSFLLVDGCLDLLATVALEVQHMRNASFLLSAVSCCHRRKPKRRLRADSYLGWCSGSEARPGVLWNYRNPYTYTVYSILILEQRPLWKGHLQENRNSEEPPGTLAAEVLEKSGLQEAIPASCRKK